jgi:hypothetical protein
MYTLLSNYNPESNEFALSLRDLDRNQGWKEVGGFYYDPADATPKPFVVQGVYESESEGQKAKSLLEVFYIHFNKATRVNVCTRSKYRFSASV